MHVNHCYEAAFNNWSLSNLIKKITYDLPLLKKASFMLTVLALKKTSKGEKLSIQFTQLCKIVSTKVLIVLMNKFQSFFLKL